jgi:tetratricopeptide (TPR) repeat protein
MKRTFLFLILWVATSSIVIAGEDTPAVIALQDDRSFRVFLMSTDGESVDTVFQRLRQKKTFELAEIDRLDFTPVGLNENEVKALVQDAQKLFQQAEYEPLIAEVDPVIAPYGDYMSINNNLQDLYGLLMEAYSRVGNYAQAGAIASNLMKTADESLKLRANVFAALAAVDREDLDAAKEFLKQVSDPAAALYVQAFIARAEGSTRVAIRTVAKIIAEHSDIMDWLPQSEFLCAQLYLETGRTNSALVTARQTAKLYEGTNIGEEAATLYEQINKLVEQSGEPEQEME